MPAFALLESYIHWRAGLGWHGLHCLTGPVHRNALPILGALSLLGAALGAALDHVLAWLRRTITALARPRLRIAGAPPLAVLTTLSPFVLATPRTPFPARPPPLPA